MAAPKGHKRYGGRVAGTPNKSTINLSEIAERVGVDPFEILLLFAKGDYKALGYSEPIEQSIRAKCASDACQYLHSKKKALEVSGDPNAPIGIRVLTDADKKKATEEVNQVIATQRQGWRS